MIPKHKLAVLIAGIKPKEARAEEDDSGHDPETEKRCLELAKEMLACVKANDPDELCRTLLSFLDLVQEEDEEQDEEEGEGGY